MKALSPHNSRAAAPTNQEESETFFLLIFLQPVEPNQQPNNSTHHPYRECCFICFCFYLRNELWMDMMMDGNSVRRRQLSIEAHNINT